jgi:hypothetical protein
MPGGCPHTCAGRSASAVSRGASDGSGALLGGGVEISEVSGASGGMGTAACTTGEDTGRLIACDALCLLGDTCLRAGGWGSGGGGLSDSSLSDSSLSVTYILPPFASPCGVDMRISGGDCRITSSTIVKCNSTVSSAAIQRCTRSVRSGAALMARRDVLLIPPEIDGRGGPSWFFCSVRRGVGHRSVDETKRGRVYLCLRKQGSECTFSCGVSGESLFLARPILAGTARPSKCPDAMMLDLTLSRFCFAVAMTHTSLIESGLCRESNRSDGHSS